jgi:hypothetical protein
MADGNITVTVDARADEVAAMWRVVELFGRDLWPN